MRKDKMFGDKKYLMGLSMVPGLGPIRCRRLISLFGSAESAYLAPREQLMEIDGIGDGTCSALVKARQNIDLDYELRRLNSLGVSLIGLEDEEYPQLLRQLKDAPVLLYVEGDIKVTQFTCVAIVGTRRATPYGLQVARKLARDLANEGVTVVSGMARGIDSSAHLGTMEAGGRTVAVLGCGIDITYPPESRGLRKKIAQCGAVVSEFPPGWKPLSGNFPARNRIISGLSIGVVVVEAGTKSGALLTANIAAEQGREVLAVPGPVTSDASRGTNGLIKDGAVPVEDYRDVLDALGIMANSRFTNADSSGTRPGTSLEPDDLVIVNALSSHEPLSFDALVTLTQIDPARLRSRLLVLELNGIVRQYGQEAYLKSLV